MNVCVPGLCLGITVGTMSVRAGAQDLPSRQCVQQRPSWGTPLAALDGPCLSVSEGSSVGSGADSPAHQYGHSQGELLSLASRKNKPHAPPVGALGQERSGPWCALRLLHPAAPDPLFTREEDHGGSGGQTAQKEGGGLSSSTMKRSWTPSSFSNPPHPIPGMDVLTAGRDPGLGLPNPSPGNSRLGGRRPGTRGSKK